MYSQVADLIESIVFLAIIAYCVMIVVMMVQESRVEEYPTKSSKDKPLGGKHNG